MVKDECIVMTGIFSEVEAGQDFDGDKLLDHLLLGVHKYHISVLASNVISNLKEMGSTNERFKW